jgi:hypothetical protein
MTRPSANAPLPRRSSTDDVSTRPSRFAPSSSLPSPPCPHSTIQLTALLCACPYSSATRASRVHGIRADANVGGRRFVSSSSVLLVLLEWQRLTTLLRSFFLFFSTSWATSASSSGGKPFLQLLLAYSLFSSTDLFPLYFNSTDSLSYGPFRSFPSLTFPFVLYRPYHLLPFVLISDLCTPRYLCDLMLFC